mgnify:CR=1 FL=1
MSLRSLLAAAAVVLVAGCATTVPVAELPPAERAAALERQSAREQLLARQLKLLLETEDFGLLVDFGLDVGGEGVAGLGRQLDPEEPQPLSAPSDRLAVRAPRVGREQLAEQRADWERFAGALTAILGVS